MTVRAGDGTRPSNFASDDHAIYIGWVLGIVANHGLTFHPIDDGEGNFTDQFTVDLGEHQVTLCIPPPPASWNPQG